MVFPVSFKKCPDKFLLLRTIIGNDDGPFLFKNEKGSNLISTYQFFQLLKKDIAKKKKK